MKKEKKIEIVISEHKRQVWQAHVQQCIQKTARYMTRKDIMRVFQLSKAQDAEIIITTLIIFGELQRYNTGYRVTQLAIDLLHAEKEGINVSE